MVASIVAALALTWIPGVEAQTTVTLDGTSGSNVSTDTLSTTDGLTINLGFFVDYLVVAGGGGGGRAGTAGAGGGGGGGGVLTSQGGSTLEIDAISHAVVVGAGGAGGVSTNSSPTNYGQDGGNSSVFGLTASGGGGGASANLHPQNGNDGGSGGGAGNNSLGQDNLGGSGEAGPPQQGFDGGSSSSGNLGRGAGGGGASEAGTSASNTGGGDGGDGRSIDITGLSVTYAGGGGGGVATSLGAAGGGGDGGGGAGNNGPGGAGVDGLGGGGGGAGGTGVSQSGGDGGDGIVIVRYEGAAAGTGGSITTVGSSTVHTFANGNSALDLTGLNLNQRLGVTLDAAITGNGDITYNGPGRLTLIGNNTYNGTTTITAGTLEVGNGVTTGNLSQAAIVNDSVLIFNSPDTITQNSLISGTGELRQNGGGTTILTGDNSYTGTTTVNAGTLLINGNQSVATGDVFVAAGATLGGSGTVGGATEIQGIHSPGNSPEIQNFERDLTYSGGSSSVLWELTNNTISNSPLAFDQIVVGGNLSFNDPTTLNLNFDISGSTVDWNNDFWGRYTYRSWLLYDVAGTTSGFTNLSLNTTNWMDRSGKSFNDTPNIPSGSYFSLSMSGSDIYLNYTGVPETTTFGLLGLVMGFVTLVTRGRRRLVPVEG